MTNEIKRYLISVNGADTEPIKVGFYLLLEICKNSESPKDAIFLMPTKTSIHRRTLEMALGSRIAKLLFKGDRVELSGGGNLKLESERTFSGAWGANIIMGVYAGKKMLNQIDAEKNVEAVIIVPWIMDEVREWIRTWNPKIIGEAPQVPEITITPVVEEALKSLTFLINTKTGLTKH